MTLEGIASSTTRGKARFVNYALDVHAEGKPIPRALDLMLHNNDNTPPTPLCQGPVAAYPTHEPILCPICDEPV